MVGKTNASSLHLCKFGMKNAMHALYLVQTIHPLQLCSLSSRRIHAIQIPVAPTPIRHGAAVTGVTVHACPACRAARPTVGQSASSTRIVQLTEFAPTSSVWTHVRACAASMRSAECAITYLCVCVAKTTLGIHFPSVRGPQVRHHQDY